MDAAQRVLALGNQIGKTYLWDLDVDDPAHVRYSVLAHSKCTSAIRQTSLSKGALTHQTLRFKTTVSPLHNLRKTLELMVWLDYDTNDSLSTNCVQFVLGFVLFLSKICHNKTTSKFVICQILYKNKTKLRQFVDNLSFVLLLPCFCPKLEK